MSANAIKDQERIGQIRLNALRNRQEQEIKAQVNAHDSRRADLRDAQASEISDIQVVHSRQILTEADKKEKVLSEMRDSLNLSRKMTDKQLSELKETSHNDMLRTRERLATERERVITENEINMNELNHKYKDDVRKVNREGQEQTSKIKQHNQFKISDERELGNRKLHEQKELNTVQYNTKVREHETLMNNTEIMNKREKLNLHRKQAHEMSQMTEAHERLSQKTEAEHQRARKDQMQMHEKRYADDFKIREKDANQLEERYAGLMNDVKAGVSKKLEQTELKSADQFYQVKELGPTLTHTEEGVVIKVRVPEYSKQDISLSLNNKEVILNYNRRFDDSHKSVDGVKNRVSRVETYTSRVDTGVHLNAKSVKSSYENGVMTYTIKKA